MPDRTQMETIGTKVGLKKGQLLEMLEKLCPGNRDFLVFDQIPNSPMPIRRNLFEKVIIRKPDDEDE